MITISPMDFVGKNPTNLKVNNIILNIGGNLAQSLGRMEKISE